MPWLREHVTTHDLRRSYRFWGGPIAFQGNWQDPTFHGHPTLNYNYGSFDGCSYECNSVCGKRWYLMTNKADMRSPAAAKIIQCAVSTVLDTCCSILEDIANFQKNKQPPLYSPHSDSRVSDSMDEATRRSSTQPYLKSQENDREFIEH